MASQKNLADELLAYAKTLPLCFGPMGKEHVWEASLLLRIGASLAEAVNKFPELSGQQKSDLVCQTVLRLLDDGEKAEKEHLAESTGTETTKVPWEELRSVVRAVLPQTLTLLVSASRGAFDLRENARGEFDLKKIVPIAVEAAPGVVSCCIGWFAEAKGKKPLQEKKVTAPPSSPVSVHERVKKEESHVFPNPLPLADLPPKERAFLEVREPLPTQ